MIGRSLLATLLFSLAVCGQLDGQRERATGTQIWFGAGLPFSNVAGLVEIGVQHSIFTVEGRATFQEVLADLAAGLDAGLLVGLATPAYTGEYIHLSATAGLAVTWFSVTDEPGQGECRVVDCPENPGLSFVYSAHLTCQS